MDKVYKYRCDDCGEEIIKSTWKRPGHRLCDDCGYKRVLDNDRQLMEHKGPFYEKWKKGLKAAAERL